MSRETEVVELECGHDVVRGNLLCVNCGEWQTMDSFELRRVAGVAKLACSSCGWVAAMPAEHDLRIGHVQHWPRSATAQNVPPPEWCPGYESSEPEPPQEQAAAQMSLF